MAWPRGAMRANAPLTVRGAKGDVPSQHWTLATWPDGSAKWTAHAISGADTVQETYHVAAGRPTRPDRPVLIRELPDSVRIVSGGYEWTVPRFGDSLLSGATSAGRQVVGNTRLVARARHDPDGPASDFTSRIDKVTVEQRGPVRAVVRINGMHSGGGRAWLPFTVRLYAYAGATHLRIVHSFVFDGDPAKDFLSGLGIRVDVPMRAPPHDRHVRFALSPDLLFAEGVRPLTGLGGAAPPQPFRDAQVEGRATPPLSELSGAVRDRQRFVPEWGDFTLAQLSPGGFTVTKRTKPGHGWIDADAGGHAPGFVYVGQPDGGAALGIRYFRERYPSQLDIRSAQGDTATLTGWLWSPRAPAMDLRFYHDGMGATTHDLQLQALGATYEDYEPGFGDAHGIARTSEMTLWACAATPPSADLLEMSAANAEPPRLMADPSSLHAAGVFGEWSLPDRSTPTRAAIEDQLDRIVDFYSGEVERRSWFGFWNHGDVMHGYDRDRHQWRYDIGGFAWDNSELSSDLWLWYAALRSADPRTWRLAEAMTRHTSEVDVYHLGRFAGFGTRHGVQHWGDSSKQPRVSTAGFRRIFYYLSGGDERTGDLMRAVLHGDELLQRLAVERKIAPRADLALAPGQVEMSFGVLWCSLAAGWLTEWERTGDGYWRDRLTAGMDSIGRMKNGWISGYGVFDLKSGRFLDRGARVEVSHLNGAFGAPELNTELLQLIDVPRYRDAWLEYCRMYNAPSREFGDRYGKAGGGRGLRQGHSKLSAFAANRNADPALAKRAAGEFLVLSGEGLPLWPNDPRIPLPGGKVEWPGMTTNAAAQWGLAAIANLALIPQALDAQPLPPARPMTR